MEAQTNYVNVDQDSFVPYQPLEMQSPEIGKLAEALAKAQSSMEGAKKDAKNPFFKSDYATLHSVWAACRGPLSSNGLSVIQTTEGAGDVTVVTTLCHSSGQWIRGKLTVKPQKTDSQALGSCITYLRRYALAAIVGLSPADDDAESAMVRRPDTGKKAAPTEAQKKAAFLKAVTPIAEKMGPDIFDSFLETQGVKSLDDLKTSKERNDFFTALKAA